MLPLCRSVKESLNKFLEADDFLNLISSSLSTNTSLVKFPRRSDHSLYVKLYVNTQADERRSVAIEVIINECNDDDDDKLNRSAD